MSKPCLILFAHGSRDPLWREPLERLAADVRTAMPNHTVQCAYLELCAPSLADVVGELFRTGTRDIKILPMFFGVGVHAREDLPQLVADLSAQYPQLCLTCEPAVGEHPAMAQAIVAIAKSA